MPRRRAEKEHSEKEPAENESAKKVSSEQIAQDNEDGGVRIPEAQHQAWYQLLRAHGKVTQSIEARLLRAQQIPHNWYDVLVTLEKAPDQRLRMSELAENVVTSRSTLTRLVDRLESEGLIRREVCPDDRRGSFAVLTQAGAKARMAAWPVVSRAIVELFASPISLEEAHVMATALRRVADAARD